MVNHTYERIRVCAVHEAGHTVAALELRMKLKFVRINAPGLFSTGDGYTETTGMRAYQRKHGAGATLKADMIVTSAGTIAEQMLYDEWGHSPGRARRRAAPGAVGDNELLAEMAEHTTFMIAEAEAEARNLLVNKWNRVQAIAEEIARHGKVTGHRLERIA